MHNKYYRKQNKYVNPFYKKKKKKESKINWRFYFYICETVALVGGLIWFFYFSTVFNVVLAQVNGVNRISESEIKDIVFEQTKQRKFLFGFQDNIFLFDSKKLGDLLQDRYFLDKLIITKEVPDKIIISLIEKDYSAIWHERDEYFFINETGSIVNKANIEEIGNYPLINNIGSVYINSNEAIDEADRISYIIKLYNEFKNKKITLVNDKWFRYDNFVLDDMQHMVKLAIKICIQDKPIKEKKSEKATSSNDAILDDQNKEIEVKEVCKQGPMIFFNIHEKLDKQVAKLLAVVNEKLKNNFGQKEYIDLRYGDKVYYK